MDIIRDAIKIFLFPDLSPSEGSEAYLPVRRWGAILGGGTLTSFEDKILLLTNQKVKPVTSWEAMEKKLEAWGVFCCDFLGDTSVHPATYEVCSLLKETAYVKAQLRDQIHRQPTLTIALLLLLQSEFNESFLQALERRQRVHWPTFERLGQDLAMGNFCLDNVALPGAFTPQIQALRSPQVVVGTLFDTADSEPD